MPSPDRIARMVRRDDDELQLSVPMDLGSSSCCVDPAGGSPAPVSVGAPGSRAQASGEIRTTQAGRQEPRKREQPRRPQHEVNTAASTDARWESRAAHLTAKAIRYGLDPERAPSAPLLLTIAALTRASLAHAAANVASTQGRQIARSDATFGDRLRVRTTRSCTVAEICQVTDTDRSTTLRRYGFQQVRRT